MPDANILHYKNEACRLVSCRVVLLIKHSFNWGAHIHTDNPIYSYGEWTVKPHIICHLAWQNTTKSLSWLLSSKFQFQFWVLSLSQVEILCFPAERESSVELRSSYEKNMHSMPKTLAIRRMRGEGVWGMWSSHFAQHSRHANEN